MMVNESIVLISNRMSWPLPRVFDFMDSKMGRWAGDEIADLEYGFRKKQLSFADLQQEVERILHKYMSWYVTDVQADSAEGLVTE